MSSAEGGETPKIRTERAFAIAAEEKTVITEPRNRPEIGMNTNGKTL